MTRAATDRSWAEVVAPVVRPAGPAPALRLGVVALVAGGLWLLGLPAAAVTAGLVGGAVALLAVVRPSAAARLDRAVFHVGRVVGHGLSFVLLGLVSALVFVPLAALARLLGRDPLALRGAAPGRWATRAADPASAPHERPFAVEVPPPGRALRVGYLTVQVVGWVVIVAVANYGLGWLWDEARGTHDQAVAPSMSPTRVGALARSGPMRGVPWADEYWDEVAGLDVTFHPYVLSRVEPVAGRYVHQDGPVRRSYEPADLPADAPEVWFLGGGALWGEGQRDEHTIASEVARLAEAAGTPIRAVNLGQPGYTSWQSALLLEQELAVHPAPDLVVVYDGADDVAVQVEQPSAEPTHYNVAAVTEALVGPDSAREQARDWWDDYRETSVVHRLLGRVQRLLGVQPAGADTTHATAAADEIADHVVDLHARSVDLASFVAGEHDVPILFAWQAATGVAGDDGAYRRVVRSPTTGPVTVVDLSGALDGVADEVFLDGVLTDERGAAQVAGRLWPLVDERLG